KALQQIGAGFQGLEEIKAAEAPAGALSLPILEADHEGGTGIPLGQTGGHNAHYPLVPAFSGEDQSPAGPHRLSLQPGLTLLKDLSLNGLALPVELAQLLGQPLRPGGVIGEEQLGGHPGLAHTPGSIDPG